LASATAIIAENCSGALTPELSGRAPRPRSWHFIRHGPLQREVRAACADFIEAAPDSMELRLLGISGLNRREPTEAATKNAPASVAAQP